MSDALVVTGDAMASLELATIGRGIVVLDAMAKRAATNTVASRTISGGRYWIVICGSVAEVEEAMDAATDLAADLRVDDCLLRNPAAGLVQALAGTLDTSLEESLLIVETTAVSSSLLAMDRVLKETDSALLEARLGAGLSGKAVFTLTGALHMMQAADEIVADVLTPPKVVATELIAQPHPDLPGRLLAAEKSDPRGRS